MKNRPLLFNGVLIPVLLLTAASTVSLLLAIPVTSADDLAPQSIVAAVPASSGQSPAQQTESPGQEDEAIRLSLKSVADSAHHLQETLRNIVYEITRQRYVTASEPNVIGPIVIPAIPVPTGQIAMGDYLPPRQKYMSNFAAQVQTMLTMLIEEASTLPGTDAADSNLNSQISTIKSDLEYLRIQNQSLQVVMAGPSYENLAVGRVVVNMSDKLDEIKKLLEELEHRISKDIKHDPE